MNPLLEKAIQIEKRAQNNVAVRRKLLRDAEEFEKKSIPEHLLIYKRILDLVKSEGQLEGCTKSDVSKRISNHPLLRVDLDHFLSYLVDCGAIEVVGQNRHKRPVYRAVRGFCFKAYAQSNQNKQ